MKDRIWNWLSDVDMWTSVLVASVRLIIIFLLSRLVIRIVYKVIDRSLIHQGKSKLRMNSRRLITAGGLLKDVTSVMCNFILILIVLGEFNFELAPLLAGAGVLGLAIGFGAQSLVKDVITGFFIILEDQFAVGDVIQTGTFRGTVEMIGLRTTRLVSHTGEVYILPNGGITTVTNYSLSNALAIVDIPMKNEHHVEATIAFIQETLKDLNEQSIQMIASPDVLGVQTLNANEFVVRIVADCLPNTRDEVERQIQMALKRAFEQTPLKIDAEEG
ncbi:mechanosensitive ion channel family protein [Paenibacillus sp. CMAA1364]